MGGTPPEAFSKLHLGYHAWMLSDGTAISTTDYIEGLGGIQERIEDLQSVQMTPYGAMDVYDSTSRIDEIFSVITELHIRLLNTETFVDDIPSDYSTRIDTVEGKLSVTDPLTTWNVNKADLLSRDDAIVPNVTWAGHLEAVRTEIENLVPGVEWKNYTKSIFDEIEDIFITTVLDSALLSFEAKYAETVSDYKPLEDLYQFLDSLEKSTEIYTDKGVDALGTLVPSVEWETAVTTTLDKLRHLFTSNTVETIDKAIDSFNLDSITDINLLTPTVEWEAAITAAFSKIETLFDGQAIESAVNTFETKNKNALLRQIGVFNNIMSNSGAVGSSSRDLAIGFMVQEHQSRVSEFEANLRLQNEQNKQSGVLQVASYLTDAQRDKLKLKLQKTQQLLEGRLQSTGVQVQLDRDEKTDSLSVASFLTDAEREKLKLKLQLLQVAFENKTRGSLALTGEQLQSDRVRVEMQLRGVQVLLDSRIKKADLQAQIGSLVYQTSNALTTMQRDKLGLKMQTAQTLLDATMRNDALDSEVSSRLVALAADIDKTKLTGQTALIETDRILAEIKLKALQARGLYVGNLSAITEQASVAARQMQQDELKLQIEDALWDLSLYDYAGKALGAISGATVIPAQPNKLLETISGVAGVGSTLVNIASAFS